MRYLPLGLAMVAAISAGAVTLPAHVLAEDDVRELAPVWHASVGTDGLSSPVIADGRVFAGTTNGLLGVDPATGAIMIVNSRTGPVSGTPAVIRGFDPQPDPPGKVIFGSRDGILRAITTAGASLWRVELGAAPTSPVVLEHGADTRIFVGAGSRVVALDGDGTPLWTTVLEGGDISRAALVLTVPTHPERIAVSAGAQLYMLDAVTGAVLWSAVPSGSALGAPTVATSSAIGDPHILVRDSTGALFSVDAGRGTVLGRYRAGLVAIGDPTIASPRVIAGDSAGNIDAFEPTDENPAPVWGTAVGGPVHGHPCSRTASSTP